MTTRYRLLRDLPDLKTGAVFEIVDKEFNFGCFTEALDDRGSCYRWEIGRGQIERNPDWFEPIDDAVERIAKALRAHWCGLRGSVGDMASLTFWRPFAEKCIAMGLDPQKCTPEDV